MYNLYTDSAKKTYLNNVLLLFLIHLVDKRSHLTGVP